MKIAFVNKGKSYLPEIKAYMDYINKQNGISAIEVYKDQKESIKKCDVVWNFMGFEMGRNNNNQFHIHEYCSLSVGKFSKQKDLLKRYLNSRPAGRVFLNEELFQLMNFKDNIPSLKRDMGISDSFYKASNKKEYDFVYIGDINTARKLDILLTYFKTKNMEQNILLIGNVSNELYSRFKNNDNIIFTGKLNHEEVPTMASKAVYGINYMPDIFPFNIQTSTKLLEYCALGLKIITTDYKWVNQFENSRGARFFKLEDSLINFTRENIEKFDFITPNVEDLKWESIFNNIGLLNYLNMSLKSY
ncbi:glycosyltransferase family 1 protein [Psychrobacillus vulpis]|uniref:Glycosyltransferase family 1 protein n=1 Tax=Psychrobacillus vulpis TaxID=2325572 RepID=A0A544TIR4_9BACI|nr:glycosyltransferase family 1 protein [Psychrobacillus vulpis]TQR17337.1 glycosyltransferase family 1 protein [Psychrobacillus vulpis]